MSESPSDVPPLPSFPPEAEVCGNCKLWRAHSVDHRGWVGPCRLQPNRGLFPPTAPICDAFVGKSESAPAARPAPTASRPRPLKSIAPTVVRKRPEGGDLPDAVPVRLSSSEPIDLGGALNMTRDELMEVFREASGQMEVPLAQKWEGGTIQLVPGKTDLQAKELPIDAFFHKVVMVRDRLRTLEQKINGHPKLTDAEKVEMQQYITRVYGSLTSFNVLFREKSDQFVGAKGED